VRFGDAVTALAGEGERVFLEVSPHPVLVPAIEAGIDRNGDGNGDRGVVVGTLRRDEPGWQRFLQSAAALHTNGTPIAWDRLFDGASVIDLPTYPFQHQHYWLRPQPAAGDATALGLSAVDHPFLAAVTAVPGTGGLLFTGRLGPADHPWLADHTIAGAVVLPGAALVELAIRAGDEVGCARLDELVITTPVVLSADVDTDVRVVVGEPDNDGNRDTTVYFRREDDEWTPHAVGRLSSPADEPPPVIGEWPPEDAEPVDWEATYELMANAGYDYGPAFQGTQTVWRRGAEVFAEIALPDQAVAEADRFGIHPALLDAALHPAVADGVGGGGDDLVRLPFSWSGVRLYACGALTARVRLTPLGPDTMRVDIADLAGRLVAQVDSLTVREAPRTTVAAAAPEDAVHVVSWVPAELDGTLAGWGLIDGPGAEEIEQAFRATRLASVEAAPAGMPVVAPLFAGSHLDAPTEEPVADVLGVIQRWLADERHDQDRLVLLTRNAMGPGDTSDIVGAGVWGLLRSAQSEHPGRFIVIDVDDDPRSVALLPEAAAADYPQAVVRAGEVFIPRLTTVAAPPAEAIEPFDGTVLITGGTGELGGVFARHLVRAHGVRSLVLASRSGMAAPDADALRDDLEALGARVAVVACDVGDRAELARVLADMPGGSPLRGVVHAAGALRDRVITGMTPDDLAEVWGSKVSGAWHLHELTRDLELRLFVVFSSVAGLLGSPAQAAYAAANSALDALVELRRGLGLPGASIGWGLWSRVGAMASAGVAWDRLSRTGLRTISAQDGTALFDRALACGHPVTYPVRWDVRALRTASRPLPPVLHELFPPARRRRAEAAHDKGTAAQRLAALAPPRRRAALADLVRAEAAAVLGSSGTDGIGDDSAFRELGFDSLTAVELRNRLTAEFGLQLPPTLVFDYPTPRRLASYLFDALFGERDGDEESAVRATLASIPLGSLREAGLLEPLLALAGHPADTPEADPTDLDDLAPAELVRRALNG
jgi:acyl transferase domain-containing protein/acyl carrier protein